MMLQQELVNTLPTPDSGYNNEYDNNLTYNDVPSALKMIDNIIDKTIDIGDRDDLFVTKSSNSPTSLIHSNASAPLDNTMNQKLEPIELNRARADQLLQSVSKRTIMMFRGPSMPNKATTLEDEKRRQEALIQAQLKDLLSEKDLVEEQQRQQELVEETLEAARQRVAEEQEKEDQIRLKQEAHALVLRDIAGTLQPASPTDAPTPVTDDADLPLYDKLEQKQEVVRQQGIAGDVALSEQSIIVEETINEVPDDITKKTSLPLSLPPPKKINMLSKHLEEVPNPCQNKNRHGDEVSLGTMELSRFTDQRGANMILSPIRDTRKSNILFPSKYLSLQEEDHPWESMSTQEHLTTKASSQVVNDEQMKIAERNYIEQEDSSVFHDSVFGTDYKPDDDHENVSLAHSGDDAIKSATEDEMDSDIDDELRSKDERDLVASFSDIESIEETRENMETSHFEASWDQIEADREFVTELKMLKAKRDKDKELEKKRTQSSKSSKKKKGKKKKKKKKKKKAPKKNVESKFAAGFKEAMQNAFGSGNFEFENPFQVDQDLVSIDSKDPWSMDTDSISSGPDDAFSGVKANETFIERLREKSLQNKSEIRSVRSAQARPTQATDFHSLHTSRISSFQIKPSSQSSHARLFPMSESFESICQQDSIQSRNKHSDFLDPQGRKSSAPKRQSKLKSNTRNVDSSNHISSDIVNPRVAFQLPQKSRSSGTLRFKIKDLLSRSERRSTVRDRVDDHIWEQWKPTSTASRRMARRTSLSDGTSVDPKSISSGRSTYTWHVNSSSADRMNALAEEIQRRKNNRFSTGCLQQERATPEHHTGSSLKGAMTELTSQDNSCQVEGKKTKKKIKKDKSKKDRTKKGKTKKKKTKEDKSKKKKRKKKKKAAGEEESKINLSLTTVKKEKMIQDSNVPGKKRAVKNTKSLEKLFSVADLETLDDKIQDYPTMKDSGKDGNTVATDAFTVDTLLFPGEDGRYLLGTNSAQDDRIIRETKGGKAESSLSLHLTKIRKPFLSGNRIKKREYREAGT